MSIFNNLCDKLRPYVGSALEELPEDEFGHNLDKDFIDVCVDIMAATWSDTLDFVYREQGEIKLRDCLLPDNLGRIERAWNLDTDRLGLSQEQIEDMMRKFGEREISDRLELPWGGYVKRVENGYELRGK